MVAELLVTGAAICTPAGDRVDATLAALLAGRVARAGGDEPSPSFDGLPIRRRDANRLTRADALGVATAGRAALEAGLGSDPALAAEAALFVGTSKDLGSYDDFLELLPDLPADASEAASLAAIVDRATGVMSPFFLLDCMPNLALHYVASMFGIRGENSCFTGLGCAGAEALAQVAGTVAAGHARVGVAAGFDRMLDPFNHSRVLAQWRLAAGGEGVPAFPGGAGAIVLEEAGHARARGASVRGRLLGAASAGRPQPPYGEPSADAALAAVRGALADAGLEPGELAFVVAGGHGAPGPGDAIAEVLDGVDVPVTAWSGGLGRLLSAGAPVEVALALECLERGVIALSGGGAPLPISGRGAMVLSLGIRGQAHAFILARKDT